MYSRSGSQSFLTFSSAVRLDPSSRGWRIIVGMKASRRSFFETVAAFASYVLTASGIVKPTIVVNRFLRCGERRKLVGTGQPAMVAMLRYLNTFDSGPGPLHGLFYESDRGDRDESGKWTHRIIYGRRDKYVAVYDPSLCVTRRFTVYQSKWHSLLYGKLPPQEVVSEAEFEAA
jgi:hypothetical protein